MRWETNFSNGPNLPMGQQEPVKDPGNGISTGRATLIFRAGNGKNLSVLP